MVSTGCLLLVVSYVDAASYTWAHFFVCCIPKKKLYIYSDFVGEYIQFVSHSVVEWCVLIERIYEVPSVHACMIDFS